MIHTTLSVLTTLLSDHLKRSFRLNESIVCLQPIPESAKTQPPNKIHLFLSHIERETAGGLRFNQQSLSSTQYAKGTPAWQLNLYVTLAALFSEKQYEQGLQLLSGTLLFLQSNNQLILPAGDILAIEPANLSFHESSNLWSISGSTYYPSILLKIRTLHLDAGDIRQMEPAVRTIQNETR